MNKNILIIGMIGIILTVLVAGGLLFLNQQNPNDKTTTQDSEEQMMKSDVSTEDNKMMTDTKSSRYVEYSNNTLFETSNTKRVLFFYANWCPTCRPVDTEIQANTDKIPEDLTIIRVNYNDTDTDQAEKDLARKYNVTYQHTFVLLDENGNEIKKWNGGGLNQILSNVN